MDYKKEKQEYNIQYYRICDNADISVVIPTIPSSNHDVVVEDLQKQNCGQSYEIIVVNDANLDVCEARNTGLKIASGEIVAFTDDDCRIKEGWLSTINSLFDDGTICVEGAVNGGINYSGRRGYLTCNLAVDRDTAIDVGGFRSEYSGWREDTEFGWRMERDGEGKCKFSSRMEVCHPTMPRASYIKENEDRLRAEYPDRYKKIMNDTVQSIMYRKLQKYGFTPLINRARYSIK